MLQGHCRRGKDRRIKRYAANDVVESENGEYVKYEDVQPLIEELERLMYVVCDEDQEQIEKVLETGA